MAIRNLIQLRAVLFKNDVLNLTTDGLTLVRLGIEPWLGKLILQCFEHRLGKEGLVLAAIMPNASSIFCRVGNEEDKLQFDHYKARKVGSAQDWYPTIGVPGCYRTVGMPFANCVNLLVIDPFKLNFWLFIFLYGN
ncbi:hypothetical protein RHGRI_031064 [Rhododendron griersonianum]|uniref:Uncharacterized protein n=1 Tax=Rhododendron griersonianum TaxID=479676 RepID=A0AAV6I9U6_9ERIC|nr:hypothetical protein RHGRI_031064 [Rhododendron griersonianum]